MITKLNIRLDATTLLHLLVIIDIRSACNTTACRSSWQRNAMVTFLFFSLFSYWFGCRFFHNRFLYFCSDKSLRSRISHSIQNYAVTALFCKNCEN